MTQVAAQRAVAPPAAAGRKRGLTGYLLLLPAGLWLTVFFIVPLFSLVSTSLYDPAGSLENGYSMTGDVGNYAQSMQDYFPIFLRSMWYAAASTLACMVLGYPLA